MNHFGLMEGTVYSVKIALTRNSDLNSRQYCIIKVLKPLLNSKNPKCKI